MNQQSWRAAPAARAGALLASIAALLGWAAGSPFDTWRALLSAIDASAATPDFDQLLGGSAALAAWIGVGWLGITVFLEVASALPGAAGRGCAAVAAKASPLLVRRIVHAVIGVSVLAGPLTAGPAFAAGPSSTSEITVGLTQRMPRASAENFLYLSGRLSGVAANRPICGISHFLQNSRLAVRIL